MYPFLQIFGFRFPSSGLFWTVGIIFGWLFLWFHHDDSFSKKQILLFMFWTVFGGLIGARALFVWQFFDPADFFSQQALAFYRGGMVFYGGLAGGIFTALCYAGRARFLANLNCFLIGLCIGHAWGRVGCFFYGCCYGAIIPSDSFFYCFAQASGQVRYPTQLLEAVFLIFLAIWLYFYHFRLKKAGAFSSYILLYGSFRFLIEFWRADRRGFMFGISSLSSGQTISIVLILLLLFFKCYRKYDKINDDG